MSKIIIFHNPRCSKSRETLALLRQNGLEPEIIEYLKTPPHSSQLQSILKLLNLPPRALLRKNETLYKDLNLEQTQLSDEEILQILSANPILIERPIVIVNNKKARIGRPPEKILEIL